MKATFIVLLLAFCFQPEAMAQYPIYLNRSQVQYGYNYGRSTMYFNGGRQPSCWSYSYRGNGVNQSHYFQRGRRVQSVYSTFYRY